MACGERRRETESAKSAFAYCLHMLGIISIENIDIKGRIRMKENGRM